VAESGRGGGRLMGSDRAVPHVRKILGERLRALRRHTGLSQEQLGKRAGLSGKFIGEVERGEKSISVDSLFRVTQALGTNLATAVYLPTAKQSMPSREVEQLYALVVRRRPQKVRTALNVLKAFLSQ